jgi:diguanylate cyclase (GGDEF)-like protein
VDVEQRLSDVLSEFARTLVTDFPIQAILDRLVVRIVDVLPVSAAGVTLIGPSSEPHYLAASDESALRFEQLQTELTEGPCIAAYELGEAVCIPDLSRDQCFPRFAARALDAGLAAVFTFPLRHGGERLGALDLYRDTPGPLGRDEMSAAQTLADVAAAYLLNAHARAELRESSDRARENALHDGLTGLPNRVLLLERLQHAILRGRRSEKMVAVLFADLDKFKAINDTYGHDVGDELLVAVADRLRSLLRPGDTLARLAGDEFVILCEDLDDPSQVEAVATRIDTALSKSFALSRTVVRVTASVGIAFAGRTTDVPERVLHDADSAMYQAKRGGGGRHQVVDLREQRLASHRATLNRDLHGSWARGELRTVYQPIVATVDGRVTGAEALIRWDHPVHGAVAPEMIVALAEQSGLISEVGRWVLERACVDLGRWQGHRHDEFGIAVNVSTYQLMSPGFSSSIAAVLAATSIDPKRVTLEVTESVFLQDGPRAVDVLGELKRIGVALALDDFGTGYSSLSYLKRFPVDTVKIDQGFISDLERDPASQSIVHAVVGLAHDLSLTVVAEGVETAEQRSQVAALGCDFSQGFYFALPMPAEDLEALLVGVGADGGPYFPWMPPIATRAPVGAGGGRNRRAARSR